MRGGRIFGGRPTGTSGDYARSGVFNAHDVFGIEGQSYECELLIIGPGGGGAGGYGGGGGGAGEVKVISSHIFQRGYSYAIVVGTGGAAGAAGAAYAGGNGSGPTTFTGPWGTESAAAGFGGKVSQTGGGNSGSGYTGGTPDATTYGGGGAGSAGNGTNAVINNGGQGGTGTLLYGWWDGAYRAWATGGGGGCYAYTPVAPPGNYVGWYGGDYDTIPSNYIAPGLSRGYGNGGGGTGQIGYAASAGDAGGVFIRHRGSVVRGSGATATNTADGWVYYRFDASGTFVG